MPRERTRFFCLFCGRRLVRRRARPAALACPGCGAVLRLMRDPGGCVTGLRVRTCGAITCCRKNA